MLGKDGERILILVSDFSGIAFTCTGKSQFCMAKKSSEKINHKLCCSAGKN
jgi:hypothetical protein